MAESIQRPGGRRSLGLTPGLVALVLFFVWSAAARPRAHDIPASAVVQAFLKPSGQRLQVILRVPLVAMRDFTFPSSDGVILDLSKVEPVLGDATRTWVIPAITILEDDRPLPAPTLVATRVVLPSDRAFASFEEAMAHFRGPSLAADTKLPVTEALFDILLEYPIASDHARFSIDPRFARFGIRVVTTLRFLMPDQPERAYQFTGDPGLVRLDPRWHQAAWRFVVAGFRHILDGIDHLLFLLCLVLPLRRFGQLVAVVTAFTVAHSVTLFCAAFGYAPDALWFPPLIETLIALSIVYMAIENIVLAWREAASVASAPSLRQAAGGGAPAELRKDAASVASPPSLRQSAGGGAPVELRKDASHALRRRWLIAFGFGLVHGFGFSFALKETLQFAGSHLLTSLVSFNVGVELGQLLVLAILVPALALVFRFVVAERVGVIIASAIVAHTAWHWMTERGSRLVQYDWSLDAAGLATLLRWMMVVVAVVGAVWLFRAARSGRK